MTPSEPGSDPERKETYRKYTAADGHWKAMQALAENAKRGGRISVTFTFDGDALQSLVPVSEYDLKVHRDETESERATREAAEKAKDAQDKLREALRLLAATSANVHLDATTERET